MRGLPEEVRQAATKISYAVSRRSESLSWAASWPSGEGRSVAMVVDLDIVVVV